MYRAIILDDEPIIREGIRNKIKRNGLPLEVTGEFSNARDMLNLLNGPDWSDADLIFLDIKMPGMDGLSLAAELKNRLFHPPHVIVISGYSDFKYTGRAISIGVDDYLLKPIKNAQFNSVVETVLRKIDEERAAALRAEQERAQRENTDRLQREVALNEALFCTAGEHPASGLKPASAMLVISNFGTESSASQIITNFLQQTEVGPCLQQYRNFYDRRECILLAWTPYDQLPACFAEEITVFFSRYPELVVCCSRQGQKERPIWQLYWECREVLPMRFSDHCRSVFFYTQEDGHFRALAAEDITWFNSKLSEIESCFHASSGNEILKRATVSVTAILGNERIFRLSISSLNLLFREIIFTLLRAVAGCGADLADPELQTTISGANIGSMRDIEDAVNYVKNIVQLAVSQKQFQAETILPLSARLRFYIEQNYNQSITLNDLGQRFNANAAYLSSLFKKEFKVNLTDYQNRLRVERGKELLRDSDMKIIDISMFLGFNDQQYFCRVFHHYTGSSPKAYRESCINSLK